MQNAFLTDEQWKRIEPLLPRDQSRGRPWAENRRVLEGILWILKRAHVGVIYPKHIPVPALAGAPKNPRIRALSVGASPSAGTRRCGFRRVPPPVPAPLVA